MMHSINWATITIILVLAANENQGVSLEITEIRFPKFTDTHHVCPQFDILFTKNFTVSNGTYLSMEVAIIRRTRRIVRCKDCPCLTQQGKQGGFCFYNQPVVYGQEFADAAIYLNNKHEDNKTLLAKKKIGKLYYERIFGPMTLRLIQSNLTTTIQWYMPFSDECRYSKTLRGFHFECHTPENDSCGNYTRMLFACPDELSVCKTAQNMETVTCKKTSELIPFIGGERAVQSKMGFVTPSYFLCEMSIHILPETKFSFRGQYTFDSEFTLDLEPEVIQRWSNWSNTVEMFGYIGNPAKSTIENTGSKNGLGILWTGVLVSCLSVLLVIAIVIAVRMRRRLRGGRNKRKTNHQVLPRLNHGGSDSSITTLDSAHMY